MCTDRSVANKVYDEAAASISQQIQAGKQVVFICEGDPLFFGSFAYLLERLQQQFDCAVVPGISSINAASSTLQHPLTMLKESFAVISGRHSDEQLRTALQQHDSVVIMKAGQARPRILAALKDCARFEEARYLENIGRVNERMVTDLSQLEDTAGPYFSLFVITRQERDRT
jgi:precorrin-2/cobalt-factor-2 C20-methyltransferase